MSLLFIHDDCEYFGEWWLPGSNKTVSAQLRCSPEQVDLNINDAFAPLKGSISISDTTKTCLAVHGVSSKGEALTLLNTQSLGVSLNFRSGGMRQPERIIFSWVVVGVHVAPDTLFSSLRFFIPGLEVWLSRSATAQGNETPSAGTAFMNTFVVQPLKTEVTPVSHIDTSLE